MSITADAAVQVPWGTESYHVYTEITVTDDAPALISPRSMQSKTVTKTSYYRDSNNNTMWYLSVTATFNYNGVSAVCANSSHNAVAVAKQLLIQCPILLSICHNWVMLLS